MEYNIPASKRLAIYERMLRDYKWTPLGFLSFSRYRTNRGFCYYLHSMAFVSLYFLPELNNLQPPLENGDLLWFPAGARKPRYELLLRAIEAVKKVM